MRDMGKFELHLQGTSAPVINNWQTVLEISGESHLSRPQTRVRRCYFGQADKVNEMFDLVAQGIKLNS